MANTDSEGKVGNSRGRLQHLGAVMAIAAALTGCADQQIGEPVNRSSASQEDPEPGSSSKPNPDPDLRRGGKNPCRIGKDDLRTVQRLWPLTVSKKTVNMPTGPMARVELSIAETAGGNHVAVAVTHWRNSPDIRGKQHDLVVVPTFEMGPNGSGDHIPQSRLAQVFSLEDIESGMVSVHTVEVKAGELEEEHGPLRVGALVGLGIWHEAGNDSILEPDPDTEQPFIHPGDQIGKLTDWAKMCEVVSIKKPEGIEI